MARQIRKSPDLGGFVPFPLIFIGQVDRIGPEKIAAELKQMNPAAESEPGEFDDRRSCSPGAVPTAILIEPLRRERHCGICPTVSN